MNVYRLEDAEELLVIGQQGIGAANDDPRSLFLVSCSCLCKGIGLQEAVSINEKENFGRAFLGPGVSCLGSAAML